MSEDVGLLASLAAHVVLAGTCFESDGPTDEVRQLSSKGSSMLEDVVCWSAGVTGGVV